MGDELVKVDELRKEVAPVVERANALVVSSPEQYTGAADFLKAVKAAQKRVGDFFGPMKSAAHAAWKKVTETETGTLRPLIEAESLVKRRMLDYQQVQEAARQAEQRRLQAEADERARREREKAESAARLQREKEAAARAEQERLEAIARKAKNEVERQKAAEAAEAARRTAEAAAAKAAVKEDTAAAVVAPVVQVASTTPEVKGQSVRKTWKARVVDVALVPREYMVVNDQALQAFARATKGAVKLPGVEMYEETSLASASK